MYEDTGQYDKVIEVAEEYFNSNARKTNSSPAWFDKKIEKASKKLGKSPVRKTLQNRVNTNTVTSQSSVETNTMSNDELLFKYADLYEKGLLTRDEFDRKKKELLFNDNPIEPEVSSKSNQENLDNPVITIAGTNLTKLFRRNVGVGVIVQYSGDQVRLEIVDIVNPRNSSKETTAETLKFTLVKENFNVLRSLSEGELITFKTKGRSGKVVLKVVPEI